MFRWCKVFCAALTLACAVPLLGGCGKDVDPETGRALTRRVWFDARGGAHCPVCDPNVRLEVKPDDPPSAVKPFSNACEQGHAVVWAAEPLPCWRCEGTGICRDCGGSGTGAAGRPCSCGGSVEEAGAALSGRCMVCGGSGSVRWGG